MTNIPKLKGTLTLTVEHAENKPEDASGVAHAPGDPMFTRNVLPPLVSIGGDINAIARTALEDRVELDTLLLTYDEVLERLANDQSVKADDVSPAALARKVWVSGNGSPGCLYDNGPNYHRTKGDAIASCAETFSEYRGVTRALRHFHSWTSPDTHEVCSISQTTLREIL